jgi:hypothetical protein
MGTDMLSTSDFQGTSRFEIFWCNGFELRYRDMFGYHFLVETDVFTSQRFDPSSLDESCPYSQTQLKSWWSKGR